MQALVLYYNCQKGDEEIERMKRHTNQTEMGVGHPDMVRELYSFFYKKTLFSYYSCILH